MSRGRAGREMTGVSPLRLQMFGNWTFGTLVFTVLVFTVTFKVKLVKRRSAAAAAQTANGWRLSRSWSWTRITGRGSTISSSGGRWSSSCSSPCCGEGSSGIYPFLRTRSGCRSETFLTEKRLVAAPSGLSSTTRGCTTSSCRCCPAVQPGSASSSSSLPACCQTWWRRSSGGPCGPPSLSAYRWVLSEWRCCVNGGGGGWCSPALTCAVAQQVNAGSFHVLAFLHVSGHRFSACVRCSCLLRNTRVDIYSPKQAECFIDEEKESNVTPPRPRRSLETAPEQRRLVLWTDRNKIFRT